MKRWIAGVIGGFALAGMVVTAIVFGSFVGAQATAGAATSPSDFGVPPLSSATPAAPHSPGVPTTVANPTENTTGPSYGVSTTNETPTPVGDDLPLPTADNPWPANQVIPAGLNVRIGLEQTKLITACMAEQGFDYHKPGSTSYVSTSPPADDEAQQVAYATALDGDWTGTYNWEQAGCRGMAVHETGMDNAH